MRRREFVGSAIAASLLATGVARAAEDPLKALLQEVAADPTLIENAWQFRDPNVSRGVGTGTPSKRKLSKPAIDLIVAFEVASPKVYEKRYRRPIWPKGISGVTVGVGYDLKFANKAFIDRDWPMLSQEERTLLYSVVGLGGNAAKKALSGVQAVEIPWADAETQFHAFLPYPTKDTEKAFPNCDLLPDDSFGALVSLVYNRGPKISPNSTSRKEMYEIQQLMKAKDFAPIADRIRAMKRVWAGDPNARGLLIRRDAEALLFDEGLKAA